MSNHQRKPHGDQSKRETSIPSHFVFDTATSRPSSSTHVYRTGSAATIAAAGSYQPPLPQPPPPQQHSLHSHQPPPPPPSAATVTADSIPAASFRQTSHHAYPMTDPTQHHLTMEPPVAAQPALSYGMSYMSPQGAGDSAPMYSYIGQVPMEPMLQPGDPSAQQMLGMGHEVPAPTPHVKTTKRKQVKNACVNCQKACKKCDDGRPCQRCIKYNLTDTCINSPRKERKKGIKRGPYKRRQKPDAMASLVHPTETTAAGGNIEEAAFSGTVVTGLAPGMGVGAANIPAQEIPYYAYYPHQQPVLYADPNQMQPAQPGSYYYMAAAPTPHPPPPTHQAGLPGPGGAADHTSIALSQHAAPHPSYYYPHYYPTPQIPPQLPQQPPAASFASGSMAAAAAAMSGLHGAASGMGPGAATIGAPVPSAGQPSSVNMGSGGGGGGGTGGPSTSGTISLQPPSQSQPPSGTDDVNGGGGTSGTGGSSGGGSGGHSAATYPFPGNTQHTAALMIAPAMPYIPVLANQRRDSKLDILSVLCAAVLDQDKDLHDQDDSTCDTSALSKSLKQSSKDMEDEEEQKAQAHAAYLKSLNTTTSTSLPPSRQATPPSSPRHSITLPRRWRQPRHVDDHSDHSDHSDTEMILPPREETLLGQTHSHRHLRRHSRLIDLLQRHHQHHTSQLEDLLQLDRSFALTATAFPSPLPFTEPNEHGRASSADPTPLTLADRTWLSLSTLDDHRDDETSKALDKPTDPLDLYLTPLGFDHFGMVSPGPSPTQESFPCKSDLGLLDQDQLKHAITNNCIENEQQIGKVEGMTSTDTLDHTDKVSYPWCLPVSMIPSDFGHDVTNTTTPEAEPTTTDATSGDAPEADQNNRADIDDSEA